MKIILTVLALFFINTSRSQSITLTYSGTNTKIMTAVQEANKILSDTVFYRRIEDIQHFDNTTYTGAQIVSEMKAASSIEIIEYYKKHTKTNAKTTTKICINTAHLNRTLASIVNTLIHETVHAVDYITDQKWDYTHRTQYEEIPPISAPYVIGAIAESMVKS